jgi:hypothetical protein
LIIESDYPRRNHAGGYPDSEPEPELDTRERDLERDRLLEQDGFYVAQQPELRLASKNVQRVHNREMRAVEVNEKVTKERVAREPTEHGISQAQPRRRGQGASQEAQKLEPTLAEQMGWRVEGGPPTRKGVFTDGFLRNESDLVKPGTFRPVLDPAGDDDDDAVNPMSYGGSAYFHYLETERQRPTSSVQALRANYGQRNELDVYVSSVAFHDHPLFCKEDWLFAGLRMLHGEYRKRLLADMSAHYTSQLQQLINAPGALKSRLGSTQDDDDDNDDASEDRAGGEEVRGQHDKETLLLVENVIEIFARRLAEEQAIVRYTKAIYAKWQELQNERKRTGGSTTSGNTPAMVQAKELVVSDEEKERSSEMLRFMRESLVPAVKEHNHKQHQRKVDALGLSSLGAEEAEEAVDAAEAAKKFQTTQIVSAEELERMVTEAEGLHAVKKKYVLQLRSDAGYSADLDDGSGNIDDVERQRRSEIDGYQFFVALVVDGKRVMRSAAQPLQRAFAEFGNSLDLRLRLHLVHRPRSLVVQIWRTGWRLPSCCACLCMAGMGDQSGAGAGGYSIFDTLLASVAVPVPGSNMDDQVSAHAIAPTSGWYNFSSVAPMDGKYWTREEERVRDEGKGGVDDDGVDEDDGTDGDDDREALLSTGTRQRGTAVRNKNNTKAKLRRRRKKEQQAAQQRRQASAMRHNATVRHLQGAVGVRMAWSALSGGSGAWASSGGGKGGPTVLTGTGGVDTNGPVLESTAPSLMLKLSMPSMRRRHPSQRDGRNSSAAQLDGTTAATQHFMAPRPELVVLPGWVVQLDKPMEALVRRRLSEYLHDSAARPHIGGVEQLLSSWSHDWSATPRAIQQYGQNDAFVIQQSWRDCTTQGKSGIDLVTVPGGWNFTFGPACSSLDVAADDSKKGKRGKSKKRSSGSKGTSSADDDDDESMGLSMSMGGAGSSAMVAVPELDPNDPRSSYIASILQRNGVGVDTDLDGQDDLAQARAVFRTEIVQPDMCFPSSDPAKYRGLLRHRLLWMRHNLPEQFTSLNPVPLVEKDIEDDQDYLSLLRSSAAADQPPPMTGDGDGDGEIAMALRQDDRTLLHDFVKFVRERRAAKRRLRKKRAFALSSIVQEDALPQFQLDLGKVIEVFEPKRNLRPRPRQRKARALQSKGETVMLHVQVKSARNVPVRKDALDNLESGRSRTGGGRNKERGRRGRDGDNSDDESGRGAGAGGRGKGDDDDDDDDTGSNNVLVSTFVEVSFQGNTARTMVSQGANPEWNATIKLPFKPTNTQGDFTPAKLAQERAQVHIALFDERSSLDMHDRLHTEKLFLGSCSVPFTTVYMQRHLQGTFRLEMPPLFHGYVQRRQQAETQKKGRGNDRGDEGGEEGSSGRRAAAGGDAAALQEEADLATGLSLHLFLDANNSDIAFPNQEEHGSNILANPTPGEHALFQHADRWFSSVRQAIDAASAKLKSPAKELVSGRAVQVMCNGMGDEMIFLPRYLAKQQPPADIRTIQQAVRFVALVPFLEDWQAFHDTDDVWSTSAEFLELRAGDWEEHAILLHNYFIWLDEHLGHGSRFRNYLVLGTGVPEGETVYVLREDTRPSPHEYVFWNASTGQGYASTDPDCPLKDVGMLVTMNGEYPQMWANISGNTSPLMLDFDVDTNAKDWKPFFGKSGGFRPEQVRDLSTVQELNLRYKTTPALFVRQLEDMLRDMIKQQVRQWRQSIKAMRTMRTHFLQHAKSRK